MRSNIVIAGGLVLLIAIVMATLRPARLQAENASITQQGIVTEIYKTAFNDLVLKLKGNGTTYYIDGAFDDELTFSRLKDKLLYKPVVIQYPERWTPLSEGNAKYYISQLEYDGEVIFREKD